MSLRPASRPRRSRPAIHSRRGVALLIVLLALGVAMTVLTGLQSISFRQAASGRQTLARLRAHWAARAGVESCLARMEALIDAGNTGSAFAEIDDMAAVASGELDGASWSIAHDALREERAGPEDPHAKINVSIMESQDLMLLPGMTEDVADAILDWVDLDDEPRPLGAETGAYNALVSPYDPRNRPIPSLQELELVAGLSPEDLRGEDWNLNGRLDPNEDDGDASPPSDNADGALDAGWSASITADSVDPTVGGDGAGRQRLDLLLATTEDLTSRIPSIDQTQATVILALARTEGLYMEDFINTPLSTVAQASPGLPASVRNLNNDQLRELLSTCVVNDPKGLPTPGRVNLNTVKRETLDYIADLPAGIADALLVARDGRPAGFTSAVDLLDVPSMTPNRVAQLSRILSVEPGAYVISSTGRESASGARVSLRVVVHRGGLPAALTEVTTR